MFFGKHNKSILRQKAVSYTHLDVYKRQIVEFSRTFDFGEDRLMGRGSLPATFYVLTRVKYLKIYLNFFKQW